MKEACRIWPNLIKNVITTIVDRLTRTPLALFEGKLYEFELFSNVIISETRLRECLQRKERLSAEYEVRIKAPESDSIDSISGFLDVGKSEELSKQLADVSNELYVRNHELFMVECQLPGPVMNKLYHSYKRPRWYMHESLVSNCVDLGGCCSRDCGCCATRVPNLNANNVKAVRGAGHCTVECNCCSNALGLNLTVAQKDQLREDFEKSLNDRDATLVEKVVPCYFHLKLDKPVDETKELEKEGGKSQGSTKQIDTHTWLYARVALLVYFLALRTAFARFYLRLVKWKNTFFFLALMISFFLLYLLLVN